jgi:hypothetical protein
LANSSLNFLKTLNAREEKASLNLLKQQQNGTPKNTQTPPAMSYFMSYFTASEREKIEFCLILLVD